MLDNKVLKKSYISITWRFLPSRMQVEHLQRQEKGPFLLFRQKKVSVNYFKNKTLYVECKKELRLWLQKNGGKKALFIKFIPEALWTVTEMELAIYNRDTMAEWKPEL